MKIVFIGYGKYGYSSLNGLLKDTALNVELVISHPSRMNDDDSHQVLNLAQSNKIHTLQSKMLSETYIQERISGRVAKFCFLILC